MRRKGHPHGDLPDKEKCEEKAFLARRRVSMSERRRERLERKAAEETQKQSQ